MNSCHLLPAGLHVTNILGTRPPRTSQRRHHKICLGRPGSCPEIPTLAITICDDSGSLYGPSGNDPVSNRYGEAHRALDALAGRCDCKNCLAAVVHFDVPTTGCVEPTPLTRAGALHIKHGLNVPADAAGASLLGPALSHARDLAAAYPNHNSVLMVLTDWALFDNDLVEVFTRLVEFPGMVFAVGLRSKVPDAVAGPRIKRVAITADSPKGSLAMALFEGLTTHRPGRSMAQDEPP